MFFACCVAPYAFTGDSHLHVVACCCSACVDSGQSVDSIFLFMCFLRYLLICFQVLLSFLYSSATYACVCKSIMKKSFPCVSNLYFVLLFLFMFPSPSLEKAFPLLKSSSVMFLLYMFLTCIACDTKSRSVVPILKQFCCCCYFTKEFIKKMRRVYLPFVLDNVIYLSRIVQ